MRKIITFSILIISFQYAFSQNHTQETLAKLHIIEGLKNGESITKLLLEQNAYLVFYTINDKDLYLANFWTKNGSQSAGKVYKSDKSEVIKLDTSNKLYTFNWSYMNSYDSKSGTARIELIETTNKYNIKTYQLKIITNNKELIYKGYIIGDFDLNLYLK
ncbi:MAG: hypothetical protein QM535_11330 [Limnohabitans sp.]|nr:hypothetical protein [Limnohabitans sp.]